MVRCTKCRFLFEPTTVGLLPDCVQCGGRTVQVEKIQASEPAPPPGQPTQKFPIIVK